MKHTNFKILTQKRPNHGLRSNWSKQWNQLADRHFLSEINENWWRKLTIWNQLTIKDKWIHWGGTIQLVPSALMDFTETLRYCVATKVILRAKICARIQQCEELCEPFCQTQSSQAPSYSCKVRTLRSPSGAIPQATSLPSKRFNRRNWIHPRFQSTWRWCTKRTNAIKRRVDQLTM